MKSTNAMMGLMTGLALWTGSSLMAQQKMASKSSVPMADKKFLKDAAQGGMAEVALSKLAIQKGSSDAVKEYGQHMVDDHTKANSELMEVAQSKGVTLPSDLKPADKALQAKLSRLSGASFDKLYVSSMLKDHIKDVSDFKKEANRGKDADVKSFASKTLPTLQDHLKMIQGIKGQMSGGKMSGKMSHKM